MKFNVISPCAHCPFRNDIRGYLHPERAAELAKQLTEDDLSWFACHETTTSRSRSVKHPLAAQCGGQMILLHKIGRPNVAMRIAYAVGILKPEQLNTQAPVFDTFEEFVQHHSEERHGRPGVPNPGRNKSRTRSRRN